HGPGGHGDQPPRQPGAGPVLRGGVAAVELRRRPGARLVRAAVAFSSFLCTFDSRSLIGRLLVPERVVSFSIDIKGSHSIDRSRPDTLWSHHRFMMMHAFSLTDDALAVELGRLA